MLVLEDKLLFLDSQKTGGTFISHLLMNMSKLEQYVYYQNHAPGLWYSPSQFTVISVRHPLELYSSLYRYGLDGHSDAYIFSKKANNGEPHPAYDTFESFCEWMLDPEGAPRLLEGKWAYGPEIAEVMGRFTWGHFQVALQWPEPSFNNLKRVLSNFDGFGIDPVSWLDNQTLRIDYVIRQETLEKDLHKLIFDMKPEWFYQDEWPIQLRHGNFNSSTKGPATVKLESVELLKEIERKEKLLYNRFYSYT